MNISSAALGDLPGQAVARQGYANPGPGFVVLENLETEMGGEFVETSAESFHARNFEKS